MVRDLISRRKSRQTWLPLVLHSLYVRPGGTRGASVSPEAQLPYLAACWGSAFSHRLLVCRRAIDNLSLVSTMHPVFSVKY